MSPDVPAPAASRERVHAWVLAQRQDEERDQEPWTASALRGAAVRAACCAPLAGLAGLLASGQQALFSVGLCAGLVAALTFGERWLTRRGPTGTGLAVLGGLATWVLTTGALALFSLQVEADFAEVAWSQGPTEAAEALLMHLEFLDLGLLVFLSVLTLPAAVGAGSYLDRADAFWAVGPSCAAATVLACACAPLGSIGLALTGQGLEGALAASCVLALALWVYAVVSALPVLLALGVCDWLEGWAFGRPLRAAAARRARR